jgi:SAM-dependent methyltransferase
MEPFFPLHALVCEECFLVQVDEYVAPEVIFSDEYPYFSSFSDSWVAHAERYVEMIIDRLGLGDRSLAMEIASNDGYLLQHLVDRGIEVLGIEPAGNVADAAREKGVNTVCHFFGTETARLIVEQHGQPNLLIGNNVLAHVPDINDFVAGMQLLLAPGGVITMEFPHLQKLMEENQFDTIYHEHYCYLSLGVVQRIFRSHGLEIFDVEEISTHGGSLRIYARHRDDGEKAITRRVSEVLDRERSGGLDTITAYSNFAERVEKLKRELLKFFIKAKDEGKTVAGYGAPGKGNTLLNYCGIRTDLLDYTVDRNPLKQGCFTAGCRIPIYPPEKIRETQPDYLFILPWNLSDEIVSQTSYIREWGGRWVTPIPHVRVHD